MSGRAGDDIYHLYSTRNQAVEDANNGVDTVKTWMSYVLPAHIENLTVTGCGRQAVGNGLDTIVPGGSGPPPLTGRAGNDVPTGPAGAADFARTARQGTTPIVA